MKTELRVGNYVLFTNGSFNFKITGIDNVGFEIENDNEITWVEHEVISPIPLTEEILLKIKGFELTYDSPHSKIIELYNHEKRQAVKVRFQKKPSSFEVSFDYVLWNHVKHLHTLQNCFKSRYNEELEINL